MYKKELAQVFLVGEASSLCPIVVAASSLQPLQQEFLKYAWLQRGRCNYYNYISLLEMVRRGRRTSYNT